MKKSYPLHFTLEDGTKVEVNKTGADTYDFTLNMPAGRTEHFTFVDEGKPFAEVEDSLEDFDQLDALRTFWLERQSIE